MRGLHDRGVFIRFGADRSDIYPRRFGDMPIR